MRYRVLGRTGMRVSELGLGGHEYARFLNPVHFPGERKAEEEVSPDMLMATQGPRNELIKRAIEAGVNYFDTTLIEEAQSLGVALKTIGKRREVHVAAENLWPLKVLGVLPRSKWQDAVLEMVENRLKALRTDYIDVFNVHMPEEGYSRKIFDFLIETLKEIKAEGKIRAIGASSHRLNFLAELMRKYDCFDSIMIPYNYHRQEARKAFFPLCKALNVGIVAMKPFCWPYYGISFIYFCPATVDTGEYTPSQISLKWILRSPEVSTVVPGTNSIKELEDNLGVFTKEGEINEDVLKRSLEFAFSPEGKAKLKELCENGEIARVKAYIKGYAKMALETGGGY
ncbi:MAG: aldo/keto reductase [Candidatus Freyarchaeota archaeon]